ncbi:baseplate wedge subunit [Morganella phage vB_MmoM_MP1]|uniref:Baseplate wedge subunit n=1 Tax=Morganella phage vB_MmoM_MP1 TaxID=1852628 RepID=A0A192YAL6_9CAUD|nr:baseplate wedge subunit [Morganella phage vB_MmoM_MP1]ANM46538.1 baseplate wedge subunit [Morganella phage vB_MmoM_MP1]
MGNMNLLYSDLDPGLNKAWDNDVQKIRGARAVKMSLLGIILTKKGTRAFDPEFGCDIDGQLFENMSPLIADTIERNIKLAIRDYEPRIDKLSVNVIALHDSNAIIVEVIFSIVDNPDVLEQIKLRLTQ